MKHILIIFILSSFLFAWPHKIYQATYKNIECDVWENVDWGYTMTYLVQIEEPYAILHIKIKCPNGNVWTLINEDVK